MVISIGINDVDESLGGCVFGAGAGVGNGVENGAVVGTSVGSRGIGGRVEGIDDGRAVVGWIVVASSLVTFPEEDNEDRRDGALDGVAVDDSIVDDDVGRRVHSCFLVGGCDGDCVTRYFA